MSNKLTNDDAQIFAIIQRWAARVQAEATALADDDRLQRLKADEDSNANGTQRELRNIARLAARALPTTTYKLGRYIDVSSLDIEDSDSAGE